jgi:tRNA modification GTPase
MHPADTIAAVATAAGRAGIGIIRVSGPGAVRIAAAATGGQTPLPRRAVYGKFVDADGQVIDEGIVLFFPAPHSYTGEDVLELQGHGGPAVLRMLLQRCLELGARLAEPGEFTRRAFLNDKLDLAQAEAVADLIDASSAAAARGAMRSLTGEFSARVNAVRDQLIETRVLVEAALDFPEEDIEFPGQQGAARRLEAIAAQLQEITTSAKQGNLLREGIRAVLLGQPNVGKSSLMNRLAEEDVAIVTEVPGTTRDALRRELVIEGVPLHLVDTAGLRDSDDPVERLGVERAWAEIARADILLHVIDLSTGAADRPTGTDPRLSSSARKIFIFNKIDLVGHPVQSLVERDGSIKVWLSAKSGAGLAELKHAILDAAGWRNLDEAPFMARERHLAALAAAAAAVERGAGQLAAPELLAEELRVAQVELGRISGEFSAEDLLGEIFSRFCVGK